LFVVLFDLTRKPLVPVGIVRGNRCLSIFNNLESLLTGYDNRKTGRNTKALLRTSDNDIQVPGIETNLLRTDRADTIDNDQGIGRDRLDSFSNSLDIRENTSAIS
jgi:hypothetical protein